MEDDIIIIEPDGIADSIDKHFCGIGEQPNSNILNKSNPSINENLLHVRDRNTFGFYHTSKTASNAVRSMGMNLT